MSRHEASSLDPIRLVAFDLDGTLTRGDTVIECLARAMGHLDHARALEVRHEARRDRESLRRLREEIAACYRGIGHDEICRHLTGLRLAPGVREGFRLLHAAAVETAIVTFTWEFAAAWLARELGTMHWLGTRLGPDGGIEHVWAEDKARWLMDLIDRRGLRRTQVAAVGDSWRDVDMLRVAGRAFYVGATAPAGLDIVHVPDGNVLTVARAILDAEGAAMTHGGTAGDAARGHT